MSRHFAWIALVLAACGVLPIRTATAQTGASGTLSQRLEQFRDDLLGDGVSDDDDLDGDARPPVNSRPPQSTLPTATPRSVPTQSSAPAVVAKPAAQPTPIDQPTPSVGQMPTPARPMLRSAAPASGEQAPTLAKRPTVPTEPAKSSASSTGSSRRTAQPGYKPGKTAPPAEYEEETPPPEPTLARQPREPQSREAQPRSAEPEEKHESPPPRLARSARTEVSRSVGPEPPADAEVKVPPAKTSVQTKGSHVREGDVLFSSQSPQLSVEASGPHKVLIGKPATFVIKLRNTGEVAANNVLVTINIPPFAEVAEAQPTAGITRNPSGTEHHEPFEWRIARFEAHNRETLTLKIVPRKSIPIDLAVQWTCSPEVTQTLVEVQEPKLAMALSGPAEVHYGQTKIYKLSISNPGNGDAENVTVSLLPIGRGAEGTASHKIGLLKAGQSKSIEVELTARQAGALTIRAQAYGDGGLRAEAAEPVLVRRANLKLNVEGPKVKFAGTTGLYRVHLVNNGDATAENVQVSAILPPQAKYVSSNASGRAEADRGKVVWLAGNVQPGGERIFEVNCALFAPGENRVQVLVTGDDELSISAAAHTRVDALADLKLEIRDPQGPIPLGEDAVFEVIIRNRGTKSAEDVDLVVFFSEGLEATSVQGGAHEIGRGQVSFKTIPLVTAGSEIVLRVHARADRAANHVFRAELVCQSLGTKLAAEETTRFYGEDDGEQPRAASHQDEPPLQPVPNE